MRRVFVGGEDLGQCNDAAEDGEETAHRSRKGTRKSEPVSSAETSEAQNYGTIRCSCSESLNATNLRMKAILLAALATGAMFLTGCETTAVVDGYPSYRHVDVHYSGGRPYYYTG